MMFGQLQSGILASVIVSVPFLAAAEVTSVDRTEPMRSIQPIQLAQAQPSETEEQKKKREREKKGPEKAPQPPKAPPQVPPKAAPQVPPKAAPLPPKGPQPPPPTEKKVLPPNTGQPPPEKKSLIPTPPAAKFSPPGAPEGVAPAPERKKELPKRIAPGQPPVAPEKGPAALPKAATPAPPVAAPPVGAPLPPPAASGATPQFQRAPQVAAPAPRFDQVQKGRRERVEEGGRRTVIEEPGNRVIVKQDNRIIIHHDEAERFRRLRDARTERRADGVVETFYVRPDGFRVVTEVDASGRLVRRYRRGPDGREYSIIDNRRFLRNVGIAVGLGAIGVAIALNLAPPVVHIPREQYIVDYERASDEELYEALSAPPVDRLERAYSLEEVRYSYELREHMRRVDLDAIHFEFGAFEVAPDQYPKLERLARAILRVLHRNPDEVFLIEGHTDAVGSDVDNLSLSDRRAEAVAHILTETYGVPPENLITQGYGKQYLKIDTPEPERANRRVAIRRITPLMAER
jgi:outer membrane protein OmpA-like peptidoglycan-associated protein